MKKDIAQISTFSYQGQDLDVLVDKGKISYVFEYKGNRYGNAVKVDGKARLAVAQAVFNLLLNFFETYGKVKGDGNVSSSD